MWNYMFQQDLTTHVMRLKGGKIYHLMCYDVASTLDPDLSDMKEHPSSRIQSVLLSLVHIQNHDCVP